MGNACCGAKGAVVVGYKPLNGDRAVYSDNKSDKNSLYKDDDKENDPLINPNTSKPIESYPIRPWTSPPKRRVFDYQEDNENVTTIYNVIHKRERPSLAKSQSCVTVPVNPRHRPKTPSFGRENTGYSLGYELPNGYSVDYPSTAPSDQQYTIQTSSNFSDKEGKSENKSSGYSSSVSFHISPTRSSPTHQRNTIDDGEDGNTQRRGLRRQNSLTYKLPGGYAMPTNEKIEPARDYQILKVHADDEDCEESDEFEETGDSDSYHFRSSAKLDMRKTVDAGEPKTKRSSYYMRSNYDKSSTSNDSAKSYSEQENNDCEGASDNDNKPRDVEKLKRYFESMNDGSDRNIVESKGVIDSEKNSVDSSRTSSDTSEQDRQSNKEPTREPERHQVRLNVELSKPNSEKQNEQQKQYDSSSSSSDSWSSRSSEKRRKPRKRSKRKQRSNSSENQSDKDSTAIAATQVSSASVRTGSMSDENELRLLKEIQVLKKQLASLLSEKNSPELVLHPIMVILQQFVQLRQEIHTNTQKEESRSTAEESVEPDEIVKDENWTNLVQKQKEEQNDADEKFARELSKKNRDVSDEDINAILKDHMNNREKLRRKQENKRERLRREIREKLDKRKRGDKSEMGVVIETAALDDEVSIGEQNINLKTERNGSKCKVKQDIEVAADVKLSSKENPVETGKFPEKALHQKPTEVANTAVVSKHENEGRNITIETPTNPIEEQKESRRLSPISDRRDDPHVDKPTTDIQVPVPNVETDACIYEEDFEEDEANETVDDQYRKVLDSGSIGSNDDLLQSDSEMDLPVFEQTADEKELLDILEAGLLKKKGKLSREDFNDLMALYREQQKILQNQQNTEELRSSESLKDKLEARRRKRLEAQALAEMKEDEETPGSIAVQTETTTMYVTDAEIQTVMDEILDDENKMRSIQIMDRGFLRKLEGRNDLTEDEMKELLERHLLTVSTFEKKKEEQRLKQLGILEDRLKQRKSRKENKAKEADIAEEDDVNVTEDKEINEVQKEIITHCKDKTEDELKELLEKHHQRRRALLRRKQFDQLKNEDEIKKRLEERRKKRRKEENNDEEKEADEKPDEYSDKPIKEIALEKELAELDTRFFKDLKKKKKNKELTDSLLLEMMKEHNDNSDWIRKQRESENTDSSRRLRQKLKERREKAKQRQREKREAIETGDDEDDPRERHQQNQEEEKTMRRYSLQRAESVIVRTKKREDELRMVLNDEKEQRKRALKERLDKRKEKKRSKAGEQEE